MIAYILSKDNLAVKDFFYYNNYLFCDDIEYSDKSKIIVPRLVNVVDDDIVYCKDDNNSVMYWGIAYNTNTNDETENISLTMAPKEALFDRFIFAAGESTIATSIEQFIAERITGNWVSTGDTLMDRAYINPVVQTNTPVAASLSNIVNVENGIFNLKTFLGNVKERYGIFIDFELSNTNPSVQTVLNVNIYKDSSSTIPIDTDVSDISSVDETYSVDVLAKCVVKWLNTSTNATTYRTFYLLEDRTTTEDGTNVNRVDGIVKSIYVEADSESAMLEEVSNEFRNNSYEHKITFYLREDSKLYKPDDYYVGRKCMVETKSGVKTSLITAIEKETGTGTRKITMGKLKVTLTSKLRGALNG